MRTFNRICPACGCLNRKLYLEETGGLMECERCGTISRGSFDSDKTLTAFLMVTGSRLKWNMPGIMAVVSDFEQPVRSDPDMARHYSA